MPAALPEPRLARAFVGRDAELDGLKQAYAAGGVFLVVRGSAGLGKSRLVRELTTWAVGRGATVLAGRSAATGRDEPLRPIREALLGAARAGLRPPATLAPVSAALARLVPEWGAPTDVTPESGVVLGEALLRLLVALRGDGATTVLVVEDLHWADADTIAALEHLADNLRGAPVLVVATVRDGEPGPGSELATSLVARHVAYDLSLAPLPPDAARAVAASCLGDTALPVELADVIVARSEGVPFLVEELLAAAATADGNWRDVAAAVPSSFASSVDMRVEALGADARLLLQLAAVTGEQFDWELIADAAGVDHARATDRLRGAARAQLLDVDDNGFAFRHALTRDAVLDAAGLTVRSRLARLALDALRRRSAELPGDRCQLAAELASTAGAPDEAAALLLEAARRALAGGTFGSAEALARRARAAAGDEQQALRDDIDEVLRDVRGLSGSTVRAAPLDTARLRPPRRSVENGTREAWDDR